MRNKKLYALALKALIFFTIPNAMATTSELDECINTLNSINQEYPVNFKQVIIDVCYKKFTDQMAALPIESPDSEYSTLEGKRKVIAAIGGNPEGKSLLSNDEKIKAYDIFSSAQKGNASAQFLLSKILHGDQPSDKANKLELQWIILSANGGYAPAQTALGDIYRTGANISEKNTKIARDWYQKAVNQRNVEAMYQLAYLLVAGDGGTKDVKKATALIKEAERLAPNIQATTLLAKIYLNGDGIDRDWREAASLFKLIATSPSSMDNNETNRNASYTLGNLYEEGGYGLKKDLNEAKYWYLNSNDFKDSKIRLRFLGNPKGLSSFYAEQERLEACWHNMHLCNETCKTPTSKCNWWGCEMVENPICIGSCRGRYQNCVGG